MGRRNPPKARPVKQENNISIVLVEPQSSGNVGAVARAMKNTGFSDLVLINPCDYMNNESYSFACKADGVLRSARVFPDLNSHLKGTGIVVGTTRRMGRKRYPVLTLAEAVPKILELSEANRVSILFGREDKGLVSTEIPLCDILLEIPTSEEYPSVNLSHAVFIVCYYLYSARSSRPATVVVSPREDVERMYEHMEATLKRLGYGEMGGAHLLETIMRSFRRLFGRTGLMQKEVNMLRGIFTQIESRVPSPGGEDA